MALDRHTHTHHHHHHHHHHQTFFLLSGENDVLLLYLKRFPRSWSYTLYGYFSGAQNLTRGAAVLLLLPLLKRGAKLRDTTLVLAGLVSKMAGLLVLGLSQSTWMVFIGQFIIGAF
jgi:PCFT/HCP family folate transporter-like MFS transporter 1/3